MPVNFKLKYSEPDMLVCWLKSKQDRDILLNDGWYRIPVSTNLEDLKKVKYLSFYQPVFFGKEGLRIKHYGTIENITIVKRKELFPKEKRNEKSELEYYKIQLKDMNILRPQLYSKRGRRIIFISTTLNKLLNASELNDLFHKSPLEDKLWVELKKNKIETERQYYTKGKNKCYVLDFVSLCKKGKLDIECDGYSYHITKESAIKDNERDNFLTKRGWSILRYSTKQLNNIVDCVAEINETIYNKGGPESEENLNKFYGREKRVYDAGIVEIKKEFRYPSFSDGDFILRQK